MRISEDNPTANAVTLRYLLDDLDTLDRHLRETTTSDVGAVYPWAVAAGRNVMEGFHAFGIENELRPGRASDMTVRTFTALKRMQLAAAYIAQPQKGEAEFSDVEALLSLQAAVGVAPWSEVPSLIPVNGQSHAAA